MNASVPRVVTTSKALRLQTDRSKKKVRLSPDVHLMVSSLSIVIDPDPTVGYSRVSLVPRLAERIATMFFLPLDFVLGFQYLFAFVVFFCFCFDSSHLNS